jgi:hypothetical protein
LVPFVILKVTPFSVLEAVVPEAMTQGVYPGSPTSVVDLPDWSKSIFTIGFWAKMVEVDTRVKIENNKVLQDI